AMVISMREKGYRRFIIAEENRNECAIIKDVNIYPFKNLNSLIDYLNKNTTLKPYKLSLSKSIEDSDYDLDFSDIKGQETLKRALQIAAAGNHNLLMIGPPGSGKTFSAKHLPT